MQLKITLSLWCIILHILYISMHAAVHILLYIVFFFMVTATVIFSSYDTELIIQWGRVSASSGWSEKWQCRVPCLVWLSGSVGQFLRVGEPDDLRIKTVLYCLCFCVVFLTATKRAVDGLCTFYSNDPDWTRALVLLNSTSCWTFSIFIFIK